MGKLQFIHTVRAPKHFSSGRSQYQSYISSNFTISSACALQAFICRTHSIWFSAFSCSVTPFCFASDRMISSMRFCAASSILSQYCLTYTQLSAEGALGLWQEMQNFAVLLARQSKTRKKLQVCWCAANLPLPRVLAAQSSIPGRSPDKKADGVRGGAPGKGADGVESRKKESGTSKHVPLKITLFNLSPQVLP